jgi:hypothetical protein
MLTCTTTELPWPLIASEAGGAAQRIKLDDTTDATIFRAAPNAQNTPADGKLFPITEIIVDPTTDPEGGLIDLSSKSLTTSKLWLSVLQDIESEPMFIKLVPSLRFAMSHTIWSEASTFAEMNPWMPRTLHPIPFIPIQRP